MLYATDASLYQVEPRGVVIPETIDAAVRAAEICARAQVAVLPRGGGTSLAGQTVGSAVVIDFSRSCTGIGELDVKRRSVRVEPGVILNQLNDELERRDSGLLFGPDVATASHANIGGMIGNNSAGARSIVYGRTVDRLIGVEALLLLGRGETHRVSFERGAATRDPVIRAISRRVIENVHSNATLIRERFPKILRHVDGYNLDLLLDQIEAPGEPLENLNLASLVCGGEGTLAITLGAELALDPAPIARHLSVLVFNDVSEALRHVEPILRTNPSAVELVDDVILRLARRNPEQRENLRALPLEDATDSAALLYVEHQAIESLDEIDRAHDELRQVAAGVVSRQLTKPEDAARAWSLRRAGEPLLHGLPGRRKPLSFVEDTAVSPERLPEFVSRFREIVRRHGAEAAYFAHASVGCLHIRPMLSLEDPLDRARVVQIAEEISDLVTEFDGALSGEHGDGRVRSPMLSRYFGPELMRVFRDIKSIFDPDNLLNPGNIVGDAPPASIVEQTRESRAPSASFRNLETYFDYDDQHDFRGAVSMCNGAGVCRKRSGGTMCPSYRATLDERHSTRGRGNALRLAISGQFERENAADRWRDSATQETLDLCLSCKACASECPSNVDISRLKAEYLAQGYRSSGGAPWRTRLLGNARLALSLGSRAPALANALAGSRTGRRVINRMLGLAPQRSLPPLSRSLIREWEPGAHNQASSAPTVALLADCFCTFSETSIGHAAANLLQKFGYRVELADVGCCARPMISQGLLEDGIATAERTARALSSRLSDGRISAVLVAEPSCHSAIVDDWQKLRMSLSRTERAGIAAATYLVEDFLQERWDQHPLRPPAPSQDGPAPLLVHRHCHQKALLSADSTLGLLRRLGGDSVQEIQSGCCGMAGAFGYTEEHFDLSNQIAELELAPAIRSAPGGATIVAGGASCRHQIRDLLAVEALHPAEAALALLTG